MSTATTDRPDRTVLGYRRFRCRACRRGFNERTGTLFNYLAYPTDVACLVALALSLQAESVRSGRDVFAAGGPLHA